MERNVTSLVTKPEKFDKLVWKKTCFSLEDHLGTGSMFQGIDRAIQDLYHSGPLQYSIANKNCVERFEPAARNQ